MEDVVAASRGGTLPGNAALLTFDDGYAEHYDIVFPILHQRGLQGSFFAPVAPVRHGVLLDVNRVHFILANAGSSSDVADALDDEVRAARDEHDVRSIADYRAEWAHPNRWDTAETIYVKRMLQTALPEQLRAEIADKLFERFLGVDEATFAAEQYLSEDQARVMVANGMHFGSHGATHQWLNRIDRPTLEREIDTSLQFLSDLGMPTDDHWVMCYPFGGHSPEVVEVLRERHCSIGLTTQVATAAIGQHDPLLLPRYDTNDFPQ
jgi:peptidoglycan/xylan/chitin deacetylase (PgdA/CDA1 family)